MVCACMYEGPVNISFTYGSVNEGVEQRATQACVPSYGKAAFPYE